MKSLIKVTAFAAAVAVAQPQGDGPKNYLHRRSLCDLFDHSSPAPPYAPAYQPVAYPQVSYQQPAQIMAVQQPQIQAVQPCGQQQVQVQAVQPCPQPQVQVQAVQPCPQPQVQVQAVQPCPQPVQVAAVQPCPQQVQPVQVAAVQPCPQPVQVAAVQPCPQQVQVAAVQPCQQQVQVAAIQQQPAQPTYYQPVYQPYDAGSDSNFCDCYNDCGNSLAGAAGRLLRSIACPWSFIANEIHNCDGDDSSSPYQAAPYAYFQPQSQPVYYQQPYAQTTYQQAPSNQFFTTMVPVAPQSGQALSPVHASLVPDYGLPNNAVKQC